MIINWKGMPCGFTVTVAGDERSWSPPAGCADFADGFAQWLTSIGIPSRKHSEASVEILDVPAELSLSPTSEPPVTHYPGMNRAQRRARGHRGPL